CVIADGVPRSGPLEQFHLPARVCCCGLDPFQGVLVQCCLLFRRHFVQGLDHVHIIGIHPLQSSLQPGVQADGGGYRHQHHG
ncbi:DNA-binding protein, partial [Dysosmobacter welbionis]